MPQDLLQAQRHRVFFADVLALFVDHGQPIGIGILAETDVGSGRHDFPADAGQIFGRGFRRMGEESVGLPAEHRDAAAQCLEQALSQHAAGSVIGIQQHVKAAAANGRGIDDGQQADRRGGASCRSIACA